MPEQRGSLKRNSERIGVVLAVLATATQAAVPVAAFAHGGGGGGRGGGMHMGGGGMHAGGFDGRGFDGGRGFDAGRGLDGGRGFDAGRGLDGGRAGDGRFDGGGRLDGGGALDGGFAGGHFAGAGNLSRADFQRIAGQGLGRGPAGAGVHPYTTRGLADRGAAIRGNFYRGGWYGGRGWYGAHFGVWWPGGWWGGLGWGMLAGLAWADLAGWGGYGAAPVAYNYGTNVCYQDDGVYVQGSRAGSAEEYAQQASAIAAQGGADAKVADDDQWRPLGVFAMARSEETNPSTFVSLAIDKAGLLRGTYYDAVSDSTMNVTGKVDRKTQRAAWTVGGKKEPVYEAGLSNLTQQQTTILVHRDAGKVEQLLLVRVNDKDAAAGTEAPGGKAAGAAGAAGSGTSP